MLDILPEIQQTLADKGPVVALESTIITHGLPFPQNYEMAKMCESIVREQGAIPATLALVQGQIKVGLAASELESLAQDTNAVKANSRDIGWCIAKRLTAGTTVAGTMAIAARAGIDIFATGGIGGVHRGDALDISNDLVALARYPVCVVSSGAKSILDIPRTLEYLETMGVPVFTYQSEYFPAFYSRKTPWQAENRLTSLEEAADFIRAHRAFHPKPCGVLLANPIPTEAEIPFDTFEPFIEQALQRAEKAGIHGKAITPYLLKALHEMTAGQSVAANLSLVRANAELSAKLAVQIQKSN